MPRMSDELINEVLQKTDIIDLISEKVSLSKQGKSYFGLCPFHHEKTPSFSVEPERKIYNCFSCGEKGNAITFKQKTENLTFVEAVEDLAIRAHIDVSFDEYKTVSPHQRLFEITDTAKTFYKMFLSNTLQGQTAKEYLQNRGITDDVIAAFELGLAPKEFDVLFKTLSDKQYLASDMHDLGLIKKNANDHFYDLFRERIIFPIHDEHGNVVAFSGRTFLEKDESAKYINSPQTIVFTKSNVLYNLHNAINDIKKNNRILLFEGYMDVIAAYRAGIRESVASMGTSLTTEQVKLIAKYTQNVVICYDGDPAGIEATNRAIQLFKKQNIDVKIILFPDNLDPDDYLKKFGDTALKDYINNKWIDSFDFTYRKNNMNIDFTKLLDVEHFKKTIFDLIKNSSNTIIESYIKRLANDTNITIESIRQDFNQYTKRNIANIQGTNRQRIQILNKYEVAEQRALLYFLKDPNYWYRYRNEFGPIFHIDESVRQIKDIIEDIYIEHLGEELDSETIYQSFLDKLNEAQIDFFLHKCYHKDLELLDKEYEDIINTINQYQQMLIKKKLEEQIKDAVTITEKIELAKYRDVKIKEDKHGQR